MDKFIINGGKKLYGEISISGAKNAAVGDTVTIMGGDSLSADVLAGWIGTINYEVVCMFSPRIPRVYVENEQNR